MRRFVVIAAILGLAAVLGSSGAALGAGTLSARVSSGEQLPFRAVVVGLPQEANLTPGSVSVFENGDPVPQVDVIPATSAGGNEFGVVLVIDTSLSMRGAPAEQAFAAARLFAEKVDGATQLGTVTFSDRTTTLLGITDNRGLVDAALAAPPALRHGTHLYDGVVAAAELLAEATIRSGSIVVLSDGADTGSTATEDEAIAAARKSGVTVYTVGLRSKVFDREALATLAEQGGGTYSEASSPGSLKEVYAQLGGRLASQYIVRYRTAQDAGADVHVAVKVEGFGVAEARYAIPAGSVGEPFHRSPLETFLLSPAGMVLAVAVGALLVGVAAACVVRPRGQSVRARVGEFVRVEDRGGADRVLLSSKLYAGADRSLKGTGWWRTFTQEMELAEMQMQPAQLILASILGAVVLGWLLGALTGFPLIGLLGICVLFVPRAIVGSRVRKRRLAFAEQLPDNLQVMASAMRAGHSFIGALAVVVDDSEEPSASEFRRVVADEQFGLSLEESLGSAVERMDNRDLAQVALVSALQHETGGNTAEVLERVTETIRERFELRRLVRTLTAQGRMSRWVVSALPVFLLLVISAINPDYMRPLFEHPIGRLLLVIAAVLVVAGSLVIKRIVDIKV